MMLKRRRHTASAPKESEAASEPSDINLHDVMSRSQREVVLSVPEDSGSEESVYSDLASELDTEPEVIPLSGRNVHAVELLF